MQSLYFAAFGLVDVKHFYLVQDHVYTEFVGKLMFGVYCAITIIVLINMLIAMLSNSYQLISVSKSIISVLITNSIISWVLQLRDHCVNTA